MAELATLPKYDSYKNSGVEWIGVIPKNWQLMRLKNVVSINPSLPKADSMYREKACFLPMEKVSVSGKVDCSLVRPLKELQSGFTSFKNNDVIVAKITPCFENGKGAHLVNMPTHIGFGSTELHVLRVSNNFVPSFLFYLTKSHAFMDFGEKMMTGSAGQKRVPTSFISNFLFAKPSYSEQTAIANFLDKKTAQIDEAIAIKEKQVELLKERKQIIIQHAVTQGLHPDVPMKDSGVEWIGEIPNNWQMKRLKYVLEERNERSETGEEPLFMMSQIHGLVVRADYHEKAEVAASNIDNKIVHKNDLVFNKLKAHLGVFFKSNIDFKGLVSPDYAVYKPKAYIQDMKFLQTLFRHPKYIEQFIIRATGIVEGLIRLYTDDLFDITIPIPPESEQLEVLAFIETESKRYDASIEIQQQQIQKLKEYKTTLINSAVTGKIKVPGVG